MGSLDWDVVQATVTQQRGMCIEIDENKCLIAFLLLRYLFKMRIISSWKQAKLNQSSNIPFAAFWNEED